MAIGMCRASDKKCRVLDVVDMAVREYEQAHPKGLAGIQYVLPVCFTAGID